MIQFIKRSQTRHVAAKTQRLNQLNQRGIQLDDPVVVQNFANQCLWTPQIQALEVPQASEVGILALALSGWVLRNAKAVHKVNIAAAKNDDELQRVQALHPIYDVMKETLPIDVKHLQGALKDLINFAKPYAAMSAHSEEHASLMQGQDTFLAQSAYITDWGSDGHPWSRQVCARLRLTRFFENTTSDFAKFLAHSFAHIVKNGTAYMAWNANFPVFLCDLNLDTHRHCAHLLCEQCHGEALMISRPFEGVIRAKLAQKMLIVQDADGIFASMAGNFAPAMLLEKRLGGWTVTFPCGEVDIRVLESKKYPALARALAFCARNPVCERGEKIRKTRPVKKEKSHIKNSLNCFGNQSQQSPKTVEIISTKDLT